MQVYSEKYDYQEEPPRKSRKRLLLYVKLGVILVALSTVIVLASDWDSSRVIRGVSVEGNRIMDDSEITAVAGPLVNGKMKDSIDLAAVKIEIEKLPYVRKAEVSFGSDNLEVEVTERSPAAALVKPGGFLCFADRWAHILPYRLFDGIGDMPLLRNYHSGKGFRSKEIIRTVRMLNYARENYPALFCRISEVRFDSHNNEYTLVFSRNCAVVKIGKARNMDRKFAKLKEFIRSMDKDSLREIKAIDLRWRDRVVTS